GDDLRRSGVVAFSHLVDERDGVLQQRDLRLEAFEQALLRRLAVRLHLQRRAAFVDRLIDDGQVLLQRRGRLRIERALLRVGGLLEAGDRFLIVLFRLQQLAFDRLRQLAAFAGGRRRCRRRPPGEADSQADERRETTRPG